MEQAAALHRERPEVRVRADLLADPFAGDERARDPDEGQAVTGVLELRDVARGVGQLQVAHLPELALDRVLVDEPLHGLVPVERLLVQRPSGVLAVARDEVPGAPLVPGVDDAAVARGRSEPERLRLEESDLDPAGRKLAGGVDPGIAAADHDHVGRIGQVAAGAIRQGGHRRLPVRPALVIVNHHDGA